MTRGIRMCNFRPDVRQCLVVLTHIENMSKYTPGTSMKLLSVVRSFMHICPENWAAIGCAVVYYAPAAHAFSAELNVWTVPLVLYAAHTLQRKMGRRTSWIRPATTAEWFKAFPMTTRAISYHYLGSNSRKFAVTCGVIRNLVSSNHR